MSCLSAQADLTFLALCVWREGRSTSLRCQQAIAHSILNRVQRPKWWGTDICSVIFKRFQYSSLTYTKDPQLTTWPTISSSPDWQRALSVASEVLSGIVEHPMPGADSYYDDSIIAPSWTKKARCCGLIGRMRFYDVDYDYELSTIDEERQEET